MDEEVIDKYRRAGRIAAQARDYGRGLIGERAKLLDVAEAVEGKILELGGEIGFPTNIAIDEQAAHYTPEIGDQLTFKKGMLVKLDVGVHVNGYIGDTATTVEVGTNKYGMLIRASEEALMNAIDIIRPGTDLPSIGRIVENTIRSFGYKPIENLTGHGLGRYSLHDGVSIPNVDKPEKGILRAGDAVAIEPFATDGKGRVTSGGKSNIYHFVRKKRIKDENLRELADIVFEKSNNLPFSERWCANYVPRPSGILESLVRKRVISAYPILSDEDGGMVSQAEHSVLLTDGGCEILTRT